jgi:pSer/pThr/pTyr-binding forkhead associated (FHA) protein
MKLSLLVLTSGKQEGKLIEIKLPQFVIGRDPQCHLRPASPLISKRHCMLIQKDNKAFIRDFDSTNGSFVNGEPVKGERELHNDDQLKIGPIEFTVRVDPTASPSRTPVPPTKPATAIKAPAAAAKPTTEKTPPPATTKTPAKAPAGKTGSAEDDIAAMLLELDGGEPSSSSDGSGVPEGSTILDIKIPTEGGQPPGKDDKKPKSASGDTRSAAASILEKMMKRPRT